MRHWTKLEAASEDEKADIIVNLLSGNPEKLGSFFSEPVQVSDNYIYEIANYGSGVAPFLHHTCHMGGHDYTCFHW